MPTPNSHAVGLIYRAHWLNLTPRIACVSNLNVVSCADVGSDRAKQLAVL